MLNRDRAGSCVYVIGDPVSDGPVKIGTTYDLRSRLTSIRSGRGAVVPGSVNLAALAVLAEHPGGRTLEANLHDYYAPVRLVGEWFDLEPRHAHSLIPVYLSEAGTVGAVKRRGVECHCVKCAYGHPPELRPGDRPELANPSFGFLSAVNAMTHARLGVDFCDSVVALPASHCDIDRAVRLLQCLGSEGKKAS